ncbi:MAG: phosphoribosylformylglycinamidine synthase subunit PurS [Bdellovibrionaceae bacterium]|nr:phosphoribosylformylglycinamidine synthase subunit PurS [Pseudobdellovibrionaceae bacterium]MBX3035135.1 phosphoribosylformylglycinamidine synthase subunit PurS [Pseudobdellovibrionaceae bacterium]
MKFGVKIMPREVILDTQGRAVEQTLKGQSFRLDSCRVGKFVEIDVPAATEAEGRDMVKKMADFVLYNPLIEVYEIQRLG